MKNNQQTIVVGSSGMGKTTKYVIPTVKKELENGSSVIVTDPLKSVYEATKDIAEKHGYKICVLNLQDVDLSQKWNPLTNLASAPNFEKRTCVDAMAKAMVCDGPDSFFTEAERSLLEAIILYVLSPYYKGEKTLSAVYDLIQKMIADNFSMPELEKSVPPENEIMNLWQLFQAAGRLKINFATSLAIKLHCLGIESVKTLLSENEIDTDEFRTGKVICYVIPPSMTKNFLATLFLNGAFESCLRNKEGNTVHIILDEFSFLQRLYWVAGARAVKNFSLSMIINDAYQLKKRYPLEYRTLLQENDLYVLGINDMETAEILKPENPETLFDIAESKMQVRKNNIWESVEIIKE